MCVALVLAALAWLPQLQVGKVDVSGVSYVDEAAVRQASSELLGEPLAFIPAGRVEERVKEIPGVGSVDVTRNWPSTARVTVRERTPIARLKVGGKEQIIDGDGVVLPPAAATDAHLTSVSLEVGTKNPEAATQALIEVVQSLPSTMQQATKSAKASAASNVTLTIVTDEGEKTVVWGGPEDAELKVRVVQALLSQKGDVIDVSSPQAPTVK